MGIRAEDFEEIMFADDLNAFQELEAAVDDASAFVRTRAVQRSLHRWGEAIRVVFDPSKESAHVLSRRRPAGPNFKLLGIRYDTKLLMDEAISARVQEAGWRIHSIVRSKRYHTDSEIVGSYKAH
eukprot:6618417-Pyramimonas_sp.AAC.1